VRGAVGALLDAQGTEARFAAARFPSDEACGAPAGWLMGLPQGGDDSATLAGWSASVKQSLAGLTPAGGAPAAAAVRFVATHAPALAAHRERLVVLITSGRPDCDALNPLNACDGGSCACVGPSCAGASCALGCLDESGAFGAISSLLAGAVTTTVVGVGADAASRSTLAALAAAGGAEVSCPGGTAAECGGDAMCNGRNCGVPFLSFQSAGGAAATNEVLARRLRRSGRCRFLLNQSVSASALQVSIGGAAQPASAWTLEGPVVTLTGAACAALLVDPAPAVRFGTR